MNKALLEQSDAIALLAKIRAEITDYHLALDRRQRGDIAADRAFERITVLLGMDHWRQGVATAAQKAGAR